MKHRLKILIFIESDFVIRNFLKSGAFNNLIAEHDVTYVMPSPSYKRFVAPFEPEIFTAPIQRVDVPEDRVLMWKWLFLRDQLRPSFNKFLRERRKTYAYMIGYKAAFLFTLAHVPGLTPIFNRYIKKRLAANPCHELENLLEQERPDILIHPSTFDGCYIDDLVKEGRKRSIPTLLIMNSWDNPSLKRSMAGIPDWVSVWGEQTKQHTHRFMNIPLERIAKLGAAQFEVFRHPPRISREDFCREHNIDHNKTLVLYAGSSRNTNEMAELKLLDEAIDRDELGNITMIYRPHPWGNGGGPGGKDIIHTKWKNICIENSMKQYLLRLSNGDKTPDTADYRRTHDILCSIDALISPFSTIILEGALHGKPVMCLMTNETENIKYRKNLVHFEEMFSLDSILVAHESSELKIGILDLVAKANDLDFKSNLIKEMKFFVEQSDKPYDIALTEFIETVIVDTNTAKPPAKEHQ